MSEHVRHETRLGNGELLVYSVPISPPAEPKADPTSPIPGTARNGESGDIARTSTATSATPERRRAVIWTALVGTRPRGKRSAEGNEKRARRALAHQERQASTGTRDGRVAR